MARLVWDQTGERKYETGVNSCALYVSDTAETALDGYAPGVAWNGITSISESPEGAEANAFYADNIKYLNLVSAEDLNGSIGCYMYPNEFMACDGTIAIANGVYMHQQPRKPFCLAYKSIVGNDQLGEAYGHKLHIMYNILASPSEKEYGTVSDSPEPNELSYDLTTTPVNVPGGNKPTALITLDSTAIAEEDLGKFNAIEGILFGADAFSATATYKKGDVVEYTTEAEEGSEEESVTNVYAAKDDIATAAAWDATKWDVIGTAGPRVLLPTEIYNIFNTASNGVG